MTFRHFKKKYFLLVSHDKIPDKETEPSGESTKSRFITY